MMNQAVMKVESRYGDLLYATVNDHVSWRIKTLYTKEPDTIAWIDGMKEGETFVDIGANVGMYTIYAAKRGLKVFAFEPEAQNYALLCRSIMVNELDVSAYCVAISNEFRADSLYLSGYLPGGSCHTFGVDLDHRLEQRERPAGALKQGCISMPLDMLDIHPDHIKIDVDGFEHKVIEGAETAVRHCKSILLEVNQRLKEHMKTVGFLQDIGFKVDKGQVEKARRKEGPFEDCGNWIFYK